MTQSETPSLLNQGQSGNALAAALREALTESPHWADNDADHQRQTTLRMQRREQIAKHVTGVSGVRDFEVGTWVAVTGHPALDTHPEQPRGYHLTEIRHRAQNNLPKRMGTRISRLFAASGWDEGPASVSPMPPMPPVPTATQPSLFTPTQIDSEPRYSNTFTCVRRDIPLVPAFDPRVDWPQVHPLTAIVVGPEGEQVHTDEQGHLKLQFRGLDPQDHAHAQGASASGADRDSAWVRQASPLAGRSFGHQTPHRVGDEVLVGIASPRPTLYSAHLRSTPSAHRPARRLPWF